MKFALLSRPRTRAVLDGRLKSAGLPIQWFPVSAPLGWELPPGEEYRSIASGGFDGGEMSIASFVEAKAHGAPLSALPIFLKRGFVQRSLFCSADSSMVSPAELKGKRVGLVHYTSSMATWIRGVMAQNYQLPRSGPLWLPLTPPPGAFRGHVRLLEVPGEFGAERIEAWEELDGYPHLLEHREAFLISLLQRGQLDAVVSYQASVLAPGIRPLLAAEELLWLAKGGYPINHIFVVRESVFDACPDIGDLLLATLKESRELWVNYLSSQQRQPMEKELDRLGWDPFAYQLGEIEKRALETFMDYLFEEKRITQKLDVEELFHH